MDLSDIPLPDDLHVFTCGPLGFMHHIRSELLQRGVPAQHIRYEVFGPDLWAAQGEARTCDSPSRRINLEHPHPCIARQPVGAGVETRTEDDKLRDVG